MNSSKYLLDSELKTLEASLWHLLSTNALSPIEVRNVTLLLLAIYTGARASELLMLTKTSLNVQEGTVLVRGLKGGRDRELPLPNTMVTLLVRLMATCSTSGLLFDISYKRLFQIWHNLRTVPKCFHALRHTKGVQLYKRTKDIHLVKYVLGHKSINNTMIYLDFVRSQEELRSVME